MKGKRKILPAVEVSLDNADTVIEGGPGLVVSYVALFFADTVQPCVPMSRDFRDVGTTAVRTIGFTPRACKSSAVCPHPSFCEGQDSTVVAVSDPC